MVRLVSLTLTLAAGTVAIGLWLYAGWSYATAEPPVEGDGAMAIDCDASRPGIQSDCSYPAGSTFDVEVHVTSPPAGGYFAFQTKVRWTDGIVNYVPAADLYDEALWPECGIPARVDNTPGDSSVLFGCVPIPALSQGSTFAGPVLRFEFNCKGYPTSGLTLVPGAGDPQNGTHFLDDPGNQVGPELSNATVTCGQPPDVPPPPDITPPGPISPPPDITPPGPNSPPGDPVNGAMAIDCDASRPGIQSACFYPPGWTFDVEVHVTSPPDGGYYGLQAKVRWTDGIVNYVPTADPADEALWDRCDIAARMVNDPLEPSVLSGCVPFPSLSEGSTFTGAVLRFEFNCEASPPSSTSGLTLVPATGDVQHGTHFPDSSGNNMIYPELSNASISCYEFTPDSDLPPPGPVSPPPDITPPGPISPPGDPVNGAMAMDCDAETAGVQSACTYPAGSTFDVEVHVTSPPDGGYVGFSTKVRWADGIVNYLPAADLYSEALWPACTSPVRSVPGLSNPSVSFRCDSTVLSQAGTFTGAILRYEFNCKDSPPIPTAGLTLVPTAGSGFYATHFLDSARRGVVPELSNAIVICHEAPPPPDLTPPGPISPPGDITPPGPISPPGGPKEGGAMAVDCDAETAGVQGRCTYAEGDRFHVQVHVTDAPPDGYSAFQTRLAWPEGVLAYLPAADPAGEALWGHCDIAVRADIWNDPGFEHEREPVVLFGCVPFPALDEGVTTAGPVVQFEMTCAGAGEGDLRLATGDPLATLFLASPDGNVAYASVTNASVTCGPASGSEVLARSQSSEPEQSQVALPETGLAAPTTSVSLASVLLLAAGGAALALGGLYARLRGRSEDIESDQAGGVGHAGPR